MDWKTLLSTKRLGMEEFHKKQEENRSEFQRDYDRLIFSTPFRRLQNKTQVFPLPGSIFVHNRLTHSLEVSSVGRSLGSDVAKAIIIREPELQQTLLPEIGSIVSAACLAHDMGNPPFGHSGERAISSFFSEGSGLALKDKQLDGERLTESQWNDFIHFEGNANAFRLLSHQFKGRRKGGFAMTYTTLASIVKYPFSSKLATKSKFGFFESEKETFIKIAAELGMIRKKEEPLEYVRHPLVYLVEAADDICYQLMDIEDAHKLKLLTTEETKELFMSYITPERKTHIEKTMKIVTDINEQIAYLRSCVIGVLVKECVEVFLMHEKEILEGTFKSTLIKSMSSIPNDAYKHCEEVSLRKIYRSRDVLDIELAGFKVITTLLELMIKAVSTPQNAYSQLLINRVSSQYDINAPHLYERIQAVLDYISGMTDIFALDLYRKINGNSLPAV
ncbi:MAG: deoxyguanosinetriphosphate triphosphohydrolase [Bacteroidaceae bacterium]|nr:deoxyguanosinetriphosphate triphosphohydrolase [Bacteroidaceae bacterium]